MADALDPQAEAPAPSQSPAPEARRRPSIPSLRQRQLNRAATFAEGARPTEPLRRRSSLFSASSLDDTRQSIRSSTENLLRPGQLHTVTSEEPSHWHSVPLVFAILPAIGGLLFNDGSAIVTDLLLLGLSTMFLNWCVRVPWEWYTSAQQVRWQDPNLDFEQEDTIFEENSDTGDGELSDAPPTYPSAAETPDKHQNVHTETTEQRHSKAELRRKELMALGCCFIGPVLGAFLLHYIRSSLSRPSEGLVSNYNLTIFVLAAEIRPFSHIISLQRARILHLQRVVQRDSTTTGIFSALEAQNLAQRVDGLETRLAEQNLPGEPQNMREARAVEITSSVRQTLQPQLDALNRAVRRYEKRYTTQTIQTEARLQDLELRLKDALALAAAAARTGQQPGVAIKMMDWLGSFCAFWIRGVWLVVTYPFRVVLDMAQVVAQWVLPGKSGSIKKRTQSKTLSARQGSPDTGRMHHRNAR